MSLFKIKYKRLYNSYILKILKFKENCIIKKVYIKENNKNRNKLVTNYSFSFSLKNFTIKYFLWLKI